MIRMTKISRRALVGALLTSTAVLAASEADSAVWLRARNGSLPAAVPVLTPTAFTNSMDFHTLTAQPQQDQTVFGTGSYTGRVFAKADITSDTRIKDGQPRMITLMPCAADGIRGGISKVRWTWVGDGGAQSFDSYVMARSPAAPVGNGKAYGFQALLAPTSSPLDRITYVVADVYPNQGRTQRLVYRLLVEGSARTATKIYVSPTGSDANPGTLAAPKLSFNTAVYASGSAGDILLDCANGPILANTSVGGTGSPNVAFPIEVRPYGGSQYTLSRSGIVDFSRAVDNSNPKPNLIVNINKISLHNGSIDTGVFQYFSPFLYSGLSNYGLLFRCVDCVIQDNKAAAGDHFYIDNMFQNDGILENALTKNQIGTNGLQLGTEVELFNCSGVTLTTAYCTYKFGCNFETGWDIGYFHNKTLGTFGAMFGSDVQNRFMFPTRNAASHGGLPIASVLNDDGNERVTFVYNAETYNGSANVTIASGTATIDFLGPNGAAGAVPFFYLGSKLLFDSGPLAGMLYSPTSMPLGSRMLIAGTGLPNSSGGPYTLKFLAMNFPGAGTFDTSTDGQQIRTMTGAVKAAWDPADIGYGNFYPTKAGPAYGHNAYVLRDSFAPIAISSGLGGSAYAVTPSTLPKAKIVGAVLTCQGDSTAGSGTLTSGVDPNSGGTIVTCNAGSVPAGLIYGMTITVVLTDSSTISFKVARNINKTAVAVASGPSLAPEVTKNSTTPAYSFFIYGALATALTGANVASWSFAWNDSALFPNHIVHAGGSVVSVTAVSADRKTLTFASLPSGFTVGASPIVRGMANLITAVSGNAVTFTTAFSQISSNGATTVRIGGDLRKVISVSGSTASLASALSADITTPALFEQYVSQDTTQACCHRRLADDFGVATSSPLPAAGDKQNLVTNIIHYDNFQFQAFTQPMPRLTAFYCCYRSQGNNLQPIQMDNQPTITVGTINTHGTTSVDFNLPTLLVASIPSASPTTYYIDGAPYNGYTLTWSVSGITGASAFPWSEPGNQIRLLVTGGAAAGNFRIYRLTVSGSTVTAIIVDDLNVLQGSAWPGAVGDTVQQPMPYTDDDVLCVGVGTTASYHQARIFKNDHTAPGRGTIDRPFDAGTFFSGSALAYYMPAQVRIAALSSFFGFGLHGQKLTLNNLLLGSIHSSVSIAELRLVQTTWQLGEDTTLRTPFEVNGGTIKNLSLIDSLFSGFENQSNDRVIVDSQDVIFTNSLIGLVKGGSGYAPNPWVPTSDQQNINLCSDASTLLPFFAPIGGNPIPTFTPWFPLDVKGNLRVLDGSARIGAI